MDIKMKSIVISEHMYMRGVVARKGERGPMAFSFSYSIVFQVCMLATYRCIPIRPGAVGKPCPGMDTRVRHTTWLSITSIVLYGMYLLIHA